jgi:hypothetical protein
LQPVRIGINKYLNSHAPHGTHPLYDCQAN